MDVFYKGLSGYIPSESTYKALTFYADVRGSLLKGMILNEDRLYTDEQVETFKIELLEVLSMEQFIDKFNKFKNR